LSFSIQPEALGDTLAEMRQHLRPEDAAELEAAGVTLEDVAEATPRALVLRTPDGRVMGWAGCESGGDVGIPWLLSTTAMATVPPASVFRAGLCLVGLWRARFTRLENQVYAANKPAQAFIQALGFKVDEQPNDRGFLRFWWRAEGV
jgi:hypothetical protein